MEKNWCSCFWASVIIVIHTFKFLDNKKVHYNRHFAVVGTSLFVVGHLLEDTIYDKKPLVNLDSLSSPFKKLISVIMKRYYNELVSLEVNIYVLNITKNGSIRKYRKNSNWNCFDLVLEWFPSSIKYWFISSYWKVKYNAWVFTISVYCPNFIFL